MSMLFQGKTVTLQLAANGIANLCFDMVGESVNKINQLMLDELAEVLSVLQTDKSIKGLLMSSAKNVFIVGADIGEFGDKFQLQQDQLAADMTSVHQLFSAYEDLPYPSVAAINGLALGGGLEVCLSADYRVMANNTAIGFPEVNLGIMPGYGGTVRTSRLIGAEKALEWITSTKHYKAADALAAGMVDTIVDGALLQQAATDLLLQAIKGESDYLSLRAQKCGPIEGAAALAALFEGAKMLVAKKAGPHYPAPLVAVETIQEHAALNRDEAMQVEAKRFAALAKTDVAYHLVNVFLSDQKMMKEAKHCAAQSSAINQAAVLGAGIMGGGIAFQSASTGTPIVMKDIAQAGLDMGMAEADNLLSAQVQKGRLTEAKKTAILDRIQPTLDYADLKGVDIVVEAVVENPKVKKIVLAEVEALLSENAVLASNTSTIPISDLASVLKRPENFCGMHFFNPVHRMPLVEIIRGEKTSDQTVARTVSYALAMGKKPVVVNDCPGFLVNRVLFAYFAGFVSLLHEGVHYTAIDKAAEAFGWPMGPAYLCDVIGIDTCVHAADVMAKGLADRMSFEYQTAMQLLLAENRLGEKNGLGFYHYEKDDRGRKQKRIDSAVDDILSASCAPVTEMSAEEIVLRLMVPFAMESVRCLEEGIAASATDLDMAMLNGVGFPPFRGGIIRYIESVGVAEFCRLAKQMSDEAQVVTEATLCRPTEGLLAMATNNSRFY